MNERYPPRGRERQFTRVGGGPRNSEFERPSTGRIRRYQHKEETEEGDAVDKNPLKIAMVVLVALMLIILGYLTVMVILDEGDYVGETGIITRFMGGSDEVLLKATYNGDDVFIEVPSNAKILKSSLKIEGILPPGRNSFEAGRAPTDLGYGDLDGDLDPDVVVINYVDNNMMVMDNIGKYSLRKVQTINVGDCPIKVEVDDLSGDGFPDAAVISEDSHDLRIFHNDGHGKLRSRMEPINVGRIPTDIVYIDIEGDGDLDIGVSSLTDDSISFFENDGEGYFKPYFELPTEKNPQTVEVYDMDGDSMDDLIVANSGDMDQKIFDTDKNRYLSWYHTVSIWRNNGNGNFTRYVKDLKTQKGVLAIDIGDINQDGRPDISMTNWGYNEVSYILSDGNGDYLRGDQSELDCEMLKAYDPISQILSDLDGDGRLDMVVLSKSADSIMVFPGKADGYFGDYTMYYIGMSPSSFELFDFDGDGDLDVITSDRRSKTQVAGSNGTVSVLINLNRGVFGTYRQFRTGNSPRGVFAYDLNGDGAPEIATANYFGSTVSVLRNDGVGGFSPNKEYPIGLEPYAVILADFNNDGHIDGASADEANFRIVILESDKKGGFTTERHWFDIGGYPFSLRAKDINHDGYIDLYTSNYFQNTTTIMFNDGTSILDNTTFNDYFTVDLGEHMPYDALMEDMNGDGHYDLITVNRGDDLDPTDTISILLNDGNFNFNDIVNYKVGKEPTSAAIFDVNGDGILDLVSSNSRDDTVTVLINDGEGVLTKLEDITVGFKPLFVNYIDYDQDGWYDIIVTNSLSNDLTFLRNMQGTGFKHVRDYSIGSGPYMIDTADFDGDGREDIVVTSVNTGYAVVFDCYYYPTGFRLDLGGDGKFEFSEDGFMDYQVEIDLTDEIRDYMAEHSDDGDTVIIPLTALSQENGMVRLSNLEIIYRL